MGLEASSASKAVLLTISRAVNWFVVYKQFCNANKNFQGQNFLQLNVIWMPLAGMLLSHLLCFLFMRTEKTRRSRCPAMIVALSQIGPLLELSPLPLCPRCSKKTTRAPIAVELAERAEGQSFVSSFNFPDSSRGSEIPDVASLLSDPEDLNKLRARILRKLCVAQVPESVCCIVLALDRWMCEVYHSEMNDEGLGLWHHWHPYPKAPLMAVVTSGTLATFLVAWGFADIIISMWVKTDFVQDNARTVQFFYLVDICSWWPFLFQLAEQGNVLVMVHYLSSELVVMILLVVVGFYAIPGGSKFRGSFMKILLHFVGQVALAATLSPFLAGANLLFFDNSLTFRYLNRLYYPIRYLHVAWFITRMPQTVHWAKLVLDPVNACALTCLVTQILLVYLVVPWKRRTCVQQSAEDFKEKTGGALEVHTATTKTLTPQGEKGDSLATKIRSSLLGLRTSVFHEVRHNNEDSFVDVLNAVGDTFEALLLASQADSPRVRCAVLGVAIHPLAKASPTKLLQLLPLILPQLLLALRWRTVEDFEDCPLSCFLIEKALSLNDINLVSMVYWQLLGLATDRSDKAWHMYQEMRLRLLHALLQSDFNGRQYDSDFCEKAIARIADQRRLSHQVRVISRAVASVTGGHAGRTAALRKHLAIMQERRDRRLAEQARRSSLPEEVGSVDEEASVVRADTNQSAAGSETSSRFRTTRSRSLSLEEPVREKKQVVFSPEVSTSDVQVSTSSGAAKEKIPSGGLGGSTTDFGRHGSQDFQREVDKVMPPSQRRCCRCCFRQSTTAKADIIVEEWKADPSMQQFGNQDLSLLDADGTPLPVEPGLPLGALQTKRCFVANSAVAPVVFAFQDTEAGEDGANHLHLYAMKKGDDLRQDAFVLQIFRIMEATWAQHGLREVSLMPYNALALSPKEGMAAFVPRAKNVATILQEFDGDINQFLKKHCARSISSAYDQLCGSTAGYCIATYLLGIGDRHLDNIMITQEGHFFHIDFGFVLGDDPKPGAPSVRVPREVLEVLRQSGRYERFRDLLREAFTLVRRTARLWTALLALASSAGGNGVTPLRNDADRAIHTVRQRLHLELDDAAAAAEITAEVEQNAVAMLPVIYDKLHQAGLFWH